MKKFQFSTRTLLATALLASLTNQVQAETVIYEDGNDDYIFAGLTSTGTSFSGSFTMNSAYGRALYHTAWEIDLDSVRGGSNIESATLNFYLDDVVYAGYTGIASFDTLVSSFTLQAYTDTADGEFLFDTDSDFDGGVISALDFQADSSIDKPDYDTGWISGDYSETLAAGATYTGTLGGSTVYYADGMTDADLASRGFLGFEIDITDVLAAAAIDTDNDWLGFRLLATSTDGWTSVDRSGFKPSITATVVPEPASLGLIAAGGVMLLGRRRRK